MQTPDDFIYEIDNLMVTKIDAVTGAVVSKTDINTANLRKINYTYEIGEIICKHVREGSSLGKIAGMQAMPSLHTIYFWKRRYPDFNRAIMDAREDSADLFLDKMLRLAEETQSNEDVKVNQLKINTYKWAAEKLNKDQFGNHTKISGDPNAPLQIIVDTGIRRDLPPTKVENEYEGSADSEDGLQSETPAELPTPEPE